MVIQRANAERKEMLAEKLKKEELEQLENAIGFSKVLQKITESVQHSSCQLQISILYYQLSSSFYYLIIQGKLVVGHNMLLDVCHTLQQVLLLKFI